LITDEMGASQGVLSVTGSPDLAMNKKLKIYVRQYIKEQPPRFPRATLISLTKHQVPPVKL